MSKKNTILRLSKSLIDERSYFAPDVGDIITERLFIQKDAIGNGQIRSRYIKEYSTPLVLESVEPTKSSLYFKYNWKLPMLRVYPGLEDDPKSSNFKLSTFKDWHESIAVTGDDTKVRPHTWNATKIRCTVDVELGIEPGSKSEHFKYIQTYYTLKKMWSGHERFSSVDIKKLNISELIGLNIQIANSTYEKVTHLPFDVDIYASSRLIEYYVEDEYPIISNDTSPSKNTVSPDRLLNKELAKLSPEALNELIKSAKII